MKRKMLRFTLVFTLLLSLALSPAGAISEEASEALTISNLLYKGIAVTSAENERTYDSSNKLLFMHGDMKHENMSFQHGFFAGIEGIPTVLNGAKFMTTGEDFYADTEGNYLEFTVNKPVVVVGMFNGNIWASKPYMLEGWAILRPDNTYADLYEKYKYRRANMTDYLPSMLYKEFKAGKVTIPYSGVTTAPTPNGGGFAVIEKKDSDAGKPEPDGDFDFTPLAGKAAEVTPVINDGGKTPISSDTAEIMQVKDNRSAIVSITTDDGSVISNGWMNEKYKEYGLKGTIMLIGDTGAENPDGFRTITKYGYTDIASHSQTHTYLYTDQTFDGELYRKEIAGSAANLKAMFPDLDIIGYAPAGNTLTGRGLEYAKATYYAMRAGGGGYNTLDPSEFEWYNLRNMEIPNPDITNQDRKGIVEKAVAEKKWLIELWHHVDSGYHPMPKADAEIHYQYLAEKQASGEIWVASFNEAVKYLRERQISSAAYKVYDDCVKVAAAFDTAALPKEIFNYPLTVKTYVPYRAGEVLIRQGDSSVIKSVQTDENGSYVYADVVPNEEAAVIAEYGAEKDTRLASLTYGDNQTVQGFRTEDIGGEYQVTLPSSVSSVTVQARANAAGARIAMEPANGVVSLSGNTTVKITVTAQDGVTKSIYTVNFSNIPDGYETISSAEEFTEKINANPSGKFWLTQDITLGTEKNPIATPIAEFKGELIGSDAVNLKTIKMYIDDTKNANVGLFGEIKGAAIVKNIRLEGIVKASSLNAARNVGALAGAGTGMDNAEISNCVNAAAVKVENNQSWRSCIAGFIGDMFSPNDANGAKLTRLINRGRIEAPVSSFCGGIVGLTGNTCVNMVVSDCENYGEIAGNASNNSNGGIAGMLYKGTVQNCYNIGIVPGSKSAGIVGIVSGSDAKIISCCNIGSASTPIYNGANATMKDCYYLGTDKAIEGAEGKTDAELKTLLADEASAEFLDALDNIQWNGYTQISTPEEFQKIKDNSSGKYCLMNDIDLTAIAYEPIAYFSGELIGKSGEALPEIKLGINDTENRDVGLFRTIGGAAVIKNIKLTGTVTATGDSRNVGALAGWMSKTLTSGSEITNVINDADVTVTGAAPSIGGILGNGLLNNNDLNNLSVINFNKLINTGDITIKGAGGDQTFAGGILGQGFRWRGYGTIKDCENYGTITIEAVESGRIGGIAGSISSSGYTAEEMLTIENCYNGGTISGGAHMGGIAGQINGGRENLPSTPKMINCYNAGNLVREGHNGAGLVYTIGTNYNDDRTYTFIENCYSAGKVNGVYPASQSLYVLNRGKGTVNECGFLGTAADGHTGIEPMTLARMKALTNAPQAFKDALNAIYTVVVETSANGVLTPSGSAYVNSGSEFSVTAEPAEGYRIASVKANGVALTGNAENVYTTTINGDVTITAEFEQATVVPTIVSPTGGAFALTDGCGSITFGTVSGIGYEIRDYGICYSKTSQEPTEKLSAKAKTLVNGQFGVKLLFAPALETGAAYYTRPYVTYASADGEENTVYGAMVTTTIE